jgi:hypothetical protein
MNLADELSKKQVLSFQLNNLNTDFIDFTLKKNSEGLFNLSSGINDKEEGEIMNYLLEKHGVYSFQVRKEVTNSRIYFKYNESA